MDYISTKHISTPLGEMFAAASGDGITKLSFENSLKYERYFTEKKTETDLKTAEEFLNQLQSELDEYFTSSRKNFTVPISPNGTEFQKVVWNELLKIPFGKTMTYLQLAKLMNNRDAIRAVAGANARNPIMIIIPCHRVNGTKGSLTGYAGGLPAKQFLLDLEAGRKTAKQLELF